MPRAEIERVEFEPTFQAEIFPQCFPCVDFRASLTDGKTKYVGSVFKNDLLRANFWVIHIFAMTLGWHLPPSGKAY